MIRRIVLAIVGSAFVMGLFGSLTGCNTMHGLGQDVQQGGEKIKAEADEHR